jgi:hypothetical protein
MFWITGRNSKGLIWSSRDLVKPSYDEMVEIHNIMRGKGLMIVICQTEYGHRRPEF